MSAIRITLARQYGSLSVQSYLAGLTFSIRNHMQTDRSKKMVEFLCIEGGPIPSWIAKRLVDTLGQRRVLVAKHWQMPGKIAQSCRQGGYRTTSPSSQMSTRRRSSAENTALARLVRRMQQYRTSRERSVPPASTNKDRMTQQDAEAICNRVETMGCRSHASDENAQLYQILVAQTKLLRQLITAGVQVFR